MKLRICRLAFVFLSLTLFVSAQTAPANNSGAPGAPAVTGSGQKNYVPLWLSKSGLGDSVIYQLTGNVGIGTTSPKAKLDVSGAVNVSTSFNLGGSPFAFGIVCESECIPRICGELENQRQLQHRGWLAGAFLYYFGSW